MLELEKSNKAAKFVHMMGWLRLIQHKTQQRFFNALWRATFSH